MQPGGSATMFGTHGHAPIFNKLIASGNSLVPRLTSPGHTISFTAMQFSTPPGAIALGMAAQPAPIDLGPIGAPMNFVYIDPVVFVPFTWAPSFLGFASTCGQLLDFGGQQPEYGAVPVRFAGVFY